MKYLIALSLLVGCGGGGGGDSAPPVINPPPPPPPPPPVTFDGTLDATFNASGMTTLTVGADSDAYAVAIQPDGKILVAGSGLTTTWDFAVARYNADGTLDTTFSGDGLAWFPVGVADDFCQAMALLADGRIAVGGYSDVSGDIEWSIALLAADGTLDATFDGDGVRILHVSDNQDMVYAIAQLADGKLVVGGTGNNGINVDMTLMRFNLDGTLDPAFDTDGIVMTAIGPSGDGLYALAVQPDGKIVGAGGSSDWTSANTAVARWNADGSLDPTFSTDGKTTLAITGYYDAAHAIALQEDGSIVVAGYADNGPDDEACVVRFTSAGEPDTTFGGDGIAIFPFAYKFGALLVLADGRILADATISTPGYDIGLAMIEADGALDLTFGGGDGYVTATLGASDDYARGMVMQPDGKVVVCARVASGSREIFGLARFE